jgi:hypothetical protein
MKMQVNIEIIRKFLKDYEQLQQTIIMKYDQLITHDEPANLMYPNGQPLATEDIGR